MLVCLICVSLGDLVNCLGWLHQSTGTHLHSHLKSAIQPTSVTSSHITTLHMHQHSSLWTLKLVPPYMYPVPIHCTPWCEVPQASHQDYIHPECLCSKICSILSIIHCILYWCSQCAWICIPPLDLLMHFGLAWQWLPCIDAWLARLGSPIILMTVLPTILTAVPPLWHQ